MAVADTLEEINPPAHPVSWRTLDELPGLTMFEDTRQIAAVLFTCIELIAAGAGHAEDVLRAFAAATVATPTR